MEFNKGFFYNWRKRDLIKSTSTLLSLLLFNLLRVGMENLKSNGADSKKKKKRFVNAIFFFFLFFGGGERNRCLISGPAAERFPHGRIRSR